MKTAMTPSRPWWQESYLWLVLGLPLSAVLACVVTAWYILQGPDRIVSEDRLPQASAIAREIEQAGASTQPALVGRNHSATGGARHVKP
jgi:uncharacterized protein